MNRRNFGFFSIGLGLGLSVGVGMVAQMILMTQEFIVGVSNWFVLCAVGSIPVVLILGGLLLIFASRRSRAKA